VRSVVELAQVVAGGFLHSVELQQPSAAIHAEPHALKVLLHLQAFAVQLAFDWQSPDEQQAFTSTQLVPQALLPLLQTHWLFVQVLPLPHSVVAQQLASGMHLSPHFLKPVLQAKSQLPLQVASELDGTGHVTHLAPHAVGLSLAMQSPLHS
jgi:hypothetical protein